MSERKCLLDGIAKVECSPSSPAHVAFHGASGDGGRVGASNIPKTYRHMKLANSPVRDDQPKAYEMFERYVESFKRQFDKYPELKSIYIYSPSPGTGKTASAVALANEYMIANFVGSAKRGERPHDRPVFFLDLTDWQRDYNQFSRPKIPDHIAEPAADRYYTYMEWAMRSPYVVIDDIGVREYTEGFRGDLHTIIDHRTENELPTIYTSNLPIRSDEHKDLVDLFGEDRLADRIGDQCQFVTFGGGSKRGRRR